MPPEAIGEYPEGSSCLSTILKAKINYIAYNLYPLLLAGVLWSKR